jgi:hypothetical protein
MVKEPLRRIFPDRRVLDAVRRRVAMVIDRSLLPARGLRWRPDSARSRGKTVPIALVVVNFSTTRLLRLMLATLAGQEGLDLVSRVVIVDNGSRDGGLPFLRRVASEVDRIDLVERRRWLHHGPGLRAGLRHLDRVGDPAEAVLFVDSDVIFRDPGTLTAVAARLDDGAALIGEHRRRGDRRPGPNIQASFVGVRRDALRRRDVCPPVHDGAPLYRMQLDIERAGLPIVDFPSNHGGYILHRGRSGVAAAAEFRLGHAYATARRQTAHFMGVQNGRAIWAEAEAAHAHLLDADGDDELVRLLAERFAR